VVGYKSNFPPTASRNYGLAICSLFGGASAEWKHNRGQANLIDPTKVAYVITEEHVVFDSAQPGKY
jgi:hypothetical protein